MKAFLVVRAEVAERADREAFDRWYRDEHLADAVAAFGALGAWRGWSDVDESVHYAFYEFEDLAAARAVLDSDALKKLVGVFDARWGTRVSRTRDVVARLDSITR